MTMVLIDEERTNDELLFDAQKRPCFCTLYSRLNTSFACFLFFSRMKGRKAIRIEVLEIQCWYSDFTYTRAVFAYVHTFLPPTRRRVTFAAAINRLLNGMP